MRAAIVSVEARGSRLPDVTADVFREPVLRASGRCADTSVSPTRRGIDLLIAAAAGGYRMRIC